MSNSNIFSMNADPVELVMNNLITQQKFLQENTEKILGSSQVPQYGIKIDGIKGGMQVTGAEDAYGIEYFTMRLGKKADALNSTGGNPSMAFGIIFIEDKSAPLIAQLEGKFLNNETINSVIEFDLTAASGGAQLEMYRKFLNAKVVDIVASGPFLAAAFRCECYEITQIQKDTNDANKSGGKYVAGYDWKTGKPK